MSAYQPTIPQGNTKLNQSYQDIQNNFTQLNTTYGVDHVPLTDATPNNGYHTDIHMTPFSTTTTNPTTNYPPVAPSTVATIGQIFQTVSNDGWDTDTILWYKTGGSRLMQLTSNVTPSAATDGYTFIPGGLIIQWGYVTPGVHGDNSVSLPRSFKNAFYNAQATMKRSSSNVDTIYCTTAPASGSVSTLHFYCTSSGDPFFWFAIGS